MVVCYKIHIKSQLLSNHQETQPTGLFPPVLGVFLPRCSAHKPSTVTLGAGFLLVDTARTPKTAF